MSRWRSEHGEIITSWLVRLVLIMAVLGLLAHEIVAVVVNRVALDDSLRVVARDTATTYRDTRSLDRATQSASSSAQTEDARLVEMHETEGEVVVTLERAARTVLVHRLGPLRDLAVSTGTGRVRWGS
ncbi:hypothetical protein [Egicoccus sp. AB-alg2]|uniref:hypothetical protein n=1 Tax=Egicoccus sp. AB-alg2 TaxID=3242693 RepID=UPI00359E8D44